MITAVWKPQFASFYKGIDAQLVAEEITALGDSITPEDVVEMARDENSETHKCFTWDDSIAAEKWRKQEARQIFCNLVIERSVTESENSVPIRIFHCNEGRSYKHAELVFKVEDEYQKLLQSAYAELRAFKIKYQSLNELSEILALID